MDEMHKVLGNNRLEDVKWLCSLSESELDMMMSLKMLVLQRAKVIGHKELATKFDLKMLRALALVLMEYLKGNVENLSPGLAKPTSFMDGCSLLQCDLRDVVSIEELKKYIVTDEWRKPVKRSREEVADKEK